MSKIAILILAAGSSSRMGKIKQLLPYKHLTLLGWAIEHAKKSTANDVFCVLGANAALIKNQIKKFNIEKIYNSNYKNGLSSSIVCGINFLITKNFDSVLIMLADQPYITSEYLNELIKKSIEHPTKIIVSDYGKKVGVPAVFPKEYFKKLLNLKGDKGAGELLNSTKNSFILSTGNLIDIDTQKEYKALLNKIK